MNMVVFGAVSPWLSNWLTPVWLLGVGTLAGLILLLVLWVVLFVLSRLPGLGTLSESLSHHGSDSPPGLLQNLLRIVFLPFSRREIREVPSAIREGVLWPILIVTSCLAVFGVVGVVFVQKPAELLASLQRLPYVGLQQLPFDVPVSELEDPDDEFSDLIAHPFNVSFLSSEVRRITINSDQNLTLATRPFDEVKPGAAIDAIANEEIAWLKGEQGVNPFIDQDVETLYVKNLGSGTAKLLIEVETAPPEPAVTVIPIMAISVMAVFLLYLLQRAAGPRMSAIALATYKSEIAQPLFPLVLILGTFLLLLFIWLPYNTFGEDIKMLKDQALTVIMILGIIQAVWAASTSVSEEIEGRTALTVLSKPIGRRSFIFGKFLGISWTVGLLFILLGVLLLIAVAYKPVYDAKESVTQDLVWQNCHLEMTYTVPGLVLAFLETVVLIAVSVAISTRLPLLANIVICASIYMLGHLTPLIVQSSVGQFVFVRFFGQLIATVFPNLDHFNIQAAVAAGVPVPYVYLLWSLLYCLIYSLIAMLLALVLFEDRDLA